MRVIGVAWGMHAAAELTDAGAEFVALWPQEVLSHLLGEDAAREPTGACAIPGVAGPAEGACSCGCSAPDVRKDLFQTLNVRKPSSITEPDETPGERRRRRRREAADALTRSPAVPGPRTPSNGHHPEATDELLEAMRRICRAG